MFLYYLFSHDGQGNFDLLQKFDAPDDEEARRLVGRWPNVRPLELWQSARKVKRWV